MERIIPVNEEEKLMRTLSGQPCPNEQCDGVLLSYIPYATGLIIECRKCKIRIDTSKVKIVYEIKK
jgi:hypothetical protein